MQGEWEGGAIARLLHGRDQRLGPAAVHSGIGFGIGQEAGQVQQSELIFGPDHHPAAVRFQFVEEGH